MFPTTSRLRIAAAVIAAATAIAACGSHSSGTSSSGAPPTPAQLQQAQQDLVRFADCMRGHGATNFPDPTSPREFKSSLAGNHGPAFQSAASACRHLLPSGGPRSQSPVHTPAQVAALLAFARCLRGHGFPNFPDPTSSGQVTHQMLAQAGINLHQPAVLQAAYACVSVTHGVITRADVARFVAGQ